MSKLKALRTRRWALVLVAAILVYVTYFFVYPNLFPEGQVKVFFIQGEKVVEVKRNLPKGEDPLKVAAKQLIAGPSVEEQKNGVFSEIPEKAKILSVSRKGEIAVVNFNYALENYGGGSARVSSMVKEIVYTFTAVPGINKVQILVDNKAEVVLGGEGFVIDKPLSRNDL